MVAIGAREACSERGDVRSRGGLHLDSAPERAAQLLAHPCSEQWQDCPGGRTVCLLD